MRRFLRELKRRHVYSVAATYLVAAFVVLQLAELAAGAFALPSWFEPMIWVLCGLGFPIALVLAWAFDVTPEGVQRTPTKQKRDSGPDDPSGSAASSEREASGSGLITVGFGVGGILIAATLVGWYFLADGGEGAQIPEPGDRSIAVLPFENMGGEESRQFTEGMHDGLLTRLSRISDLKVISRTSVMQFREKELPLPAIADSLDAGWIVEGAVQQVGGQVQVNAQLIQAEEDIHRWAETYRRDLSAENVFAIQGDLTKRIARSLEAQLSSEEEERVERRPTDNLDAYQLYVQGRRQFARRSMACRSCVGEAVTLFRRAIDQDSTFALAWTGLADAAGVYSNERVYTSWPDTLARPEISQESAARRALELAPDLAEAHAAMGRFHLQHMDAVAARGDLWRALELQPSYWEAHHWLGELYLKTGYPEQALRHLELAVELNPQHAWARHYLYDAYLVVGEAEESLREARLQRRMGLEESSAIGGEVRALIVLDRLAEARKLAEEKVAELGPETVWGGWFRAYLTQILASQGDTDRARRYLTELQEADARPEMIARAHRGLGQIGEALKAYDRMTDDAWGYVGAAVEFRYGTRHGMPSMSDHPRYRRLLVEANSAWGLPPDGSFPQGSTATSGSREDG